jgi:hypothetical protein
MPQKGRGGSRTGTPSTNTCCCWMAQGKATTPWWPPNPARQETDPSRFRTRRENTMPRGSSGAVAGRTNRRGRRGGRRLRRLAPVTAGGRCRSGGGMGASWGRELKMTGVGPGAWWWSIWPLASPPGGSQTWLDLELRGEGRTDARWRETKVAGDGRFLFIIKSFVQEIVWAKGSEN